MKCLHLIDRATAKSFGLKLYFTGKPCPKGHFAERYVSGYACVTCAFLSGKSEERKTYQRQYYVENSERINARVCRRRADNLEVVKAEERKSYQKHNVLRKSKVRQYRKNNPDAIFFRDLLYRIENPEKVAANKRRRKAAKKQRTVKWDKELTDFVDLEAGHLCKLREGVTGFRWEVDHIIPMLGKEVSGLHVWNNLEVIPAAFNLRKNANFWYLEPYTWMYLI